MSMIWRRGFALAPLLLALGAGPGMAAETIKAAVSGAAESSHIFCDAAGATAPLRKAPCVLRSLYVTIATAVSGFVLVYDAVAAPADGAVTPRHCLYIAGPNTIFFDLGETAEPFVTGLTAAFSTTGCFTQTLSATAYFSGRAQ